MVIWIFQVIELNSWVSNHPTKHHCVALHELLLLLFNFEIRKLVPSHRKFIIRFVNYICLGKVFAGSIKYNIFVTCFIYVPTWLSILLLWSFVRKFLLKFLNLTPDFYTLGNKVLFDLSEIFNFVTHFQIFKLIKRTIVL